MDNRDTLHIRCGSDIRETLKEAGFVGDFLEFADPLCHGPVRDLEFDAYIDDRAEFVSSAYGGEFSASRAKILAAYDKLESIGDYQHIVLWFEHDSYDQLILARLLALLSTKEKLPPVELICISEFDVAPRFIGLGQLGPADLLDIWERRQPVSAAHFELGASVWNALVQPTPEQLSSIAEKGTEPIGPMTAAIFRHLAQLPHELSGLSLTEELTLKMLVEGPKKAGPMFRQLMVSDEPLPYLGDLMYWFELAPLLEGGAIEADAADLDWPERTMRLTSLGNSLLAGGVDWLDHVQSSRWVGGIEIKPDAKNWRRSDEPSGFRLK